MAAARARPTSSPLTLGASAGADAGRGVDVAVAGFGAKGAAPPRNAIGAAAAGAEVATGAADAPVGPPGGSVGSLIVGAAVGLGGKLIRTVSFLG